MTSQPVHTAPRVPDGLAGIVGIGASAGGLRALRALFEQVPERTGVAYVVVMHSAADDPSHLVEVLRPNLRLPVEQVRGVVRLEPDHVYLIPPNAKLAGIDSHIRLSSLEPSWDKHAPLDHFFRSLADAQEARAVGVVLSGTGSDGTLGLRHVKARGGLTVAQAPTEAEHDGLPRSAIRAALVDLVLPAARIPQAILRFLHAAPVLAEAEEHEAESFLQEVCVHLRASTGRDFRGLRHLELLRRIRHRMGLCRVEEPSAYLERLRSEPAEVEVLAEELSMTATGFFRDSALFEALETRVVPELFESRDAEATIRVWVVGCATGEEAYAITMLLLEAAERRPDPPALRVFATDPHEPALARARAGEYPRAIEMEVRSDRLARFFHPVTGGYRVRRELRDRIVFSAHDVLSDPPFLRMDLVSCREVLRRLLPERRSEVVKLLHLALRPGGFAFMQRTDFSERRGRFRVEHARGGLYRRLETSAREPRRPMLAASENHASGPWGGARRHHPPGDGSKGRASKPLAARDPAPRQDPPSEGFGALHQRIVEQYGPPSVLVSPDDEVVHLSEHAGRYLLQPAGAPTCDVLALVPEALRGELRVALSAARARRSGVRSRPVLSPVDGRPKPVALEVRPALGSEAGFLLLTFDERPEAEAPPADEVDTPAALRERVRALERERDDAECPLREVIEAHEADKEALLALNEELRSANEDFRSTMEALERSEEELRTVNEELWSVSQENRLRVEKLEQLSRDLQNLLAATDIATLFLDRALQIVRFTPGITKLFNVRHADRGRRLSDITRRLRYDQLEEDAARVLERLVPVSHEVQDDSGKWYIARILPYRAAEDRITGVVMGFVDITERKKAEVAAQKAAARDAFRVRLSDALRALRAPSAIASTAMRLLAAALGVDHAVYAEVDAEGAIRMGAAHDGGGALKDVTSLLSRLTEAPWSGGAVVSRGGGEDEVAFVCAPVLRDAQPLAFVVVARPTSLCAFTDDQVAMVEETAERTWIAVERARAEAALRESEARFRTTATELAEANRRKDEYLAMHGHELRNPLAGIRGAASLIAHVKTEDPVILRAQEVLERQSSHMARIIDGLLEVSRIARGKIEVSIEPLNLCELARRVLGDQAVPVKEQGLSLEASLSPEPVWVMGDEVRLVQVLDNLLGNAIKFTPAPGRITVFVEPEGEEVVLGVRDTGVGIRPEMLPRVFETFQQEAQDVARTKGGLGLGLALSKGLVELHGGTIEAHSAGLGCGAELVVRLPRVAPPDARPVEGPVPSAPRRLLLVEDDADAAEVTQLLLEQAGHTVRLARSGEAALEALGRETPDLVLCDVGLPAMSGYDVARAIRKDTNLRDLVLIAVTGYGQAEDRKRALEAGFDAHLVKPVGLKALTEALGRLAGPPGGQNG